MGDQETIVLDISSDEDVGWGDSVAACGGGFGRDDDDWISELLDEVYKGTDDSDEVVVVGEVIAKPKQRVAKPLAKSVNDVEDDECVILDGDPDKPVSVENDRGGDDSDDLLLVSEKGQVACRDYPHARHLCVKFPFNTTPHERNCDLCHCYVCDSLAPCVHWSTGIPSMDHCHATDKDEYWKAQRKSTKKNDKAPSVAPGVRDTSFFIGLTKPCQTPPSPSDHVMQNQMQFTQATRQLCSMATSNGMPNILTHGRTQRPGYMRRNFESHLDSQKLWATFNNVIPGDRRHKVGNAATQFTSRLPFKRAGTVGGVLTNNSYHKISFRNNYGYQCPRSNPPVARWLDPHGGVTPVLNTHQDSSRANGGIATNLMPNSSAQTNLDNGTANHMPCEPQIFPLTYGSSVNTDSVGPQYPVSSHIYVGCNFTNPIPVQPGVATQPIWDCTFDDPFPFQPQATSDPNGAKNPQNPVPSQPLLTSLGSISNYSKSAVPTQPNVDSGLENPLLHHIPEDSQPATLSNDGEYTFQQGHRTQGTLLSSSADFDFSWDSPTSQPLPVEYNKTENAVQRDEPPVTMHGDSHLPGSANPSLLDFQFDSWIFEDQSGLGALEVPVPPELGVFSPEAAPIDAALLFDL